MGFGRSCLWSPGKVLAVQHTTGLVGWEADLVLFQPSGWVHEVEVKVSVADFHRDLRKPKHEILLRGWTSPGGSGRPVQNLVRRFYFAMPAELWDKVREQIPAHAGLILCSCFYPGAIGTMKAWIEKKAPDLPARKWGAEDRDRLLLSHYYRNWRA